MKPRTNRRVERAGVNATRALFESCGHVFVEVDQASDYGKDAYVDIVLDDRVTGLCVALQIKSGRSYRRKSGYAIPVGRHASVWASSTVPVAGVIYDPELDALFWCDISGALASRDPVEGQIHVPDTQALTSESLGRDFVTAMRRRKKPLDLAALCDTNERAQRAAIWDAFGAGRNDPRAFIALRYLLPVLSDAALCDAVIVLSHLTPHPDIFWTKANWVPKETCNRVLPHFRWSAEELQRLFSVSPAEEWRRGGLGQCLFMLLIEDDGIRTKLERAAIEEIRAGREDEAWMALYVAVYLAGNAAPAVLRSLTSKEPKLEGLELFSHLKDAANEGCVDLF